jgi:hypothetical protein
LAKHYVYGCQPVAINIIIYRLVDWEAICQLKSLNTYTIS